MPFLLPNIIGHSRGEPEHHLELALAGLHAKTLAQPPFQRESLPAGKSLARLPNGFNARWDKRTDVFAQMVVGEEEPFAVDVSQVIGVDEALLGLALARLAVRQLQLLPRGGCLGQ